MHARQQILNLVRQLLESAGAQSWRGVYVSAILPGAPALPCVLVRGQGEQVGEVPNAGLLDLPVQWRTLSVSLLWVSKALPNPEDTAAASIAAAVDIERAVTLEAIQAALPQVKLGLLQSVEVNEETDESGYVSLDLVWSITYATREGDPETLLD